MRILQSSYEPVTAQLDEEEREALVARVRSGTEMRSTYAKDVYGQTDAGVWLRAYTTEDGRERWAVVHDGPEISDVFDTEDRSEAEATYESAVRDLADCVGKDEAPWWTYSDVPGIPHAVYTLLVERQQGGQWTTGRETTGHLGRVPDLPHQHVNDACTPTTLDSAAGEIAAEVVREQADLNFDAALTEAVGLPTRGETAQAVRVSVTGIGADGEETHTEVRQVPERLPTSQEIANHRRILIAVAEDEAATDRAAYGY